MNITLALDDELVARARDIARYQGLSLNELIRSYLESIAGRRNVERTVQQLEALWTAEPGHSGGRAIARDEAYEGRL